MGIKKNQANNWYQKKWGNDRAIEHRKIRSMKYNSSDIGKSNNIQEMNTNDASHMRGVVSEVQRSFCRVLFENSFIQCKIPDGIVPTEINRLVVGDRITFDLDINEGEDKQGTIKYVFPRQTKLVRMREDRSRRSEFGQEEHVLAANVDIAVIVAAAAMPTFHPRFIDRYLVMCQNGGVSPVICINKCDLVSDIPDLDIYEKMEIPIVKMSASSRYGIENLREELRGKISVLTGQSGVGKSTIINVLLGREVLNTKVVGGKSGHGRHTTTISTMHKIDEDTYLIDTPGIRSLGFWEIPKKSLRFYFIEFEAYSSKCKFNDCTHTTEPDCEVRKAVQQGKISAERYESYLRMMKK